MFGLGLGRMGRVSGVYGRGGAAPSLPLDSLSAGAAYSVRRLRTAYTGPLMRVRRSSDNTEQDIGYGGDGWLDETVLLAFVGAGSGFVKTWYDQSGNARDVSQATTANQPRIVNAGVVDLVNSRPAVVFDGSNDSLVGAVGTSYMYAAGAATVLTVVRGVPQTGKRILVEGGASLTPMYQPIYANGSVAAPYYRNDANIKVFDHNTVSVSGSFDGSLRSLGVRDTGAEVTLLNNGVAGNTLTYTRSTTTLQKIIVGSENGSTLGAFAGEVAEIVTFPTYLTNPQINNLGASQASGWGISVNPI